MALLSDRSENINLFNQAKGLVLEKKIPAIILSFVAVGILALTVFTSYNAIKTYKSTFAGLFFDPYGFYSAIYPLSRPQVELKWIDEVGRESTESARLELTDKIVSINGEPIGTRIDYVDLPAKRIQKVLSTQWDSGKQSVRLGVSRNNVKKDMRAPLSRIGEPEIIAFFVLYALVGIFLLWTGITILLISGRKEGAVVYAIWTVAVFLFCMTFYDYHTTTTLFPVFSLSTIFVQVGFFWLAYAFPEHLKSKFDIIKNGLILMTGIAFLAAVWLVLAPFYGLDTLTLRLTLTKISPISLLMLPIVTIFRYRKSTGRARAELRSALIGLIIGPVLIAAGYALQSPVTHMFLPIIASAAPLAIGYSIIKHNILEISYVVKANLFKIPVVISSLIIATVVWIVFYQISDIQESELPLLYGFSAVVFIVGLYFGYQIYSRIFFTAQADFKPSIEFLTDRMTSIKDMVFVKQSIEEVVSQWLPNQQIQVVGLDQIEQVPNMPPNYDQELQKGALVWTEDNPWLRKLLVPMMSLNQLFAVLVLSHKGEKALYTEADISLLETIGKLGGVAIQNANMLDEIEALRDIEKVAAKSDKQMTLTMIAAEIAHELAYPLNFFRYLLDQGRSRIEFSPEDLEMGQEEIDRVKRMLSNLKKLRSDRQNLKKVALAEAVNRSMTLLKDPLTEKAISTNVSGIDDLYVFADLDQLVQVFTNLLRNAINALSTKGELGISALVEEDAVIIDVWDNGPGVPDGLEASLFNPWVTSKEEGSGLGLAVSQKIVAGFGWSISYSRDELRTHFSTMIPKMDCEFRTQDQHESTHP